VKKQNEKMIEIGFLENQALNLKTKRSLGVILNIIRYEIEKKLRKRSYNWLKNRKSMIKLEKSINIEKPF
jgi:hypothetical protein